MTSSTRQRVTLDDAQASDALRRATPLQHLALVTPHLGSEAVRLALGGSNPGRAVSKHELSRLRAQGTLLGVRCGRHGYLYPSFQVDPVQGHVVPTVAKVNRALRRHLTLEDTLRWWATPSDTYEAPRHECVALEPDRLAELALQDPRRMS